MRKCTLTHSLQNNSRGNLVKVYDRVEAELAYVCECELLQVMLNFDLAESRRDSSTKLMVMNDGIMPYLLVRQCAKFCGEKPVVCFQ